MTLVKSAVFFHGNCVDGMTSAAMARKALGADDNTYTEVHHGKPFPRLDVAGKNVYVLDFCPGVEDIQRMLQRECRNLYVFDHHKTAEAMVKEAEWTLKDWDNLLITFDMNRSGAGITADFFRNRNWWVNYVEDRDLWRWKLPNSKTVNAFIQSIDRSMDGYDLAMKDHGPEEAHVLGMGAERYLDMYVREVSKTARTVRFADWDGIPLVNAQFVGISEVVGNLAKDALFAVGWSQNADGQIVVSLRSCGDFDVSELAKRFGGGGHQAAAGFTVTPPHIPSELTQAFGHFGG